MQPPPEDSDCTVHLSQWYHCSNNKGLPDSILSQAWLSSKCISFVFHHRSQGEVKVKDFTEKENIPDHCNTLKNNYRRNEWNDADSDYDPDDPADTDYT